MRQIIIDEDKLEQLTYQVQRTYSIISIFGDSLGKSDSMLTEACGALADHLQYIGDSLYALLLTGKGHEETEEEAVRA